MEDLISNVDAINFGRRKLQEIPEMSIEEAEELKKEIQQYVKEKTAPYKYPRIVVFRDELPKTTSGKIQRNKL